MQRVITEKDKAEMVKSVARELGKVHGKQKIYHQKVIKMLLRN